MSDHESFEDRLKAIAKEISRSVERMGQLDIDEVAESFGVDPDRAREFADAAGRWLSDHVEGEGLTPFFGQTRGAADEDAPADPADTPAVEPHPTTVPSKSGPHPLDLPTEGQGRALSALDSGRWSVRPGSHVLTGTGVGEGPPSAPGLVGELRARDWITADGVLTHVGRHALRRWCSASEATEQAESADSD